MPAQHEQRRGHDRPVCRLDAAHAPLLDVHARHAGEAIELRSARLGGTPELPADVARAGEAVRLDVVAGEDRRWIEHRHQARCLLGRHDLTCEAVRHGVVVAPLELGDARCRCRDLDGPDLEPARPLGAVEAAVELGRPLRERAHEPGAVRLEDEAGCVEGRAAGILERALVDHHEVLHAREREEVRGRAADDAGSDDDDVGPGLHARVPVRSANEICERRLEPELAGLDDLERQAEQRGRVLGARAAARPSAAGRARRRGDSAGSSRRGARDGDRARARARRARRTCARGSRSAGTCPAPRRAAPGRAARRARRSSAGPAGARRHGARRRRRSRRRCRSRRRRRRAGRGARPARRAARRPQVRSARAGCGGPAAGDAPRSAQPRRRAIASMCSVSAPHATTPVVTAGNPSRSTKMSWKSSRPESSTYSTSSSTAIACARSCAESSTILAPSPATLPAATMRATGSLGTRPMRTALAGERYEPKLPASSTCVMSETSTPSSSTRSFQPVAIAALANCSSRTSRWERKTRVLDVAGLALPGQHEDALLAAHARADPRATGASARAASSVR